jgi:hypothetical protein
MLGQVAGKCQLCAWDLGLREQGYLSSSSDIIVSYLIYPPKSKIFEKFRMYVNRSIDRPLVYGSCNNF